MSHLRVLVTTAFLAVLAACGPAGKPTPETPTTPPAPRVINYGDGVELRDASDVSKLKGAPADFKQYIAGAADATGVGADRSDPCSPRIFVDRIDTSGYAIGGTFDCGGAQLMWARRGATWRQIWGGQITPDCPTMKKYAVPASIAGKTCYDVKVQDDVPYTP